jgi:hypothetical protein
MGDAKIRLVFVFFGKMLTLRRASGPQKGTKKNGTWRIACLEPMLQLKQHVETTMYNASNSNASEQRSPMVQMAN